MISQCHFTKKLRAMNIKVFIKAQEQMENVFKGNEQDFYAQEDLHQTFKPKKFRLQKYFVTKKLISEPSHRDLLIKFFIEITRDIHNSDEKDQAKILTKILSKKNELFWNVFSKYDGIASICIFHISELFEIRTLPFLCFPTLTKISFQEVPLCSLEPFAWINAPLLLDIRILRCQLTRINGLDKANFPNLIRVFLAQNHIIEHDKMSRIQFFKEMKSSDLRFIIRERFFETGQVQTNETFYNREEIFASLEDLNSLNFMVKMEAINVVENCMRVLNGYQEVLTQLYMFHTFYGQGRSEDQVRVFWRKRPLVQYSVDNLLKRIDPKVYQQKKMFNKTIMQQVLTRLGPQNQWN